MLPQTQNEQIGDAVSGTRIMSSRTYRFNPESGEISGLYDDQTQVMAQAIWKRLLTPRGIYPIYSKEYGSDLWRMNGLPLAYAKPVFASYVGNGQATRTIQAGTFMKLVFLVKDGQIVGAASKDTPYVNDGITYLQVYDNHFVLGGGFCNENGITYSYFGL